jgi:hypothetical protein
MYINRTNKQTSKQQQIKPKAEWYPGVVRQMQIF